MIGGLDARLGQSVRPRRSGGHRAAAGRRAEAQPPARRGDVAIPARGVDCLAVVAAKLCRVGRQQRSMPATDGAWKQAQRPTRRRSPASPPIGDDGLAVALATGEIVVEGGRFDGRRYRAGSGRRVHHRDGRDRHRALSSPTARRPTAPPTGSATSSSAMPRAASGASTWKAATSSRLADGLAWPAGLAVDARGTGLLRGLEASARQDRSRPAREGRRCSTPTCRPIPAGSRRPRTDTGWRCSRRAASSSSSCCASPAYRKRMMAEVPQPFWVAPKLRSGRSFYESLQGGGVKHLGLLKPWAPTMSAGLLREARPGVPAALQPAEPCRRPHPWRDRGGRARGPGLRRGARRWRRRLASLARRTWEARHDADRRGPQRDQGVSRRRRR